MSERMTLEEIRECNRKTLPELHRVSTKYLHWYVRMMEEKGMPPETYYRSKFELEMRKQHEQP